MSKAYTLWIWFILSGWCLSSLDSGVTGFTVITTSSRFCIDIPGTQREIAQPLELRPHFELRKSAIRAPRVLHVCLLADFSIRKGSIMSGCVSIRLHMRITMRNMIPCDVMPTLISWSQKCTMTQKRAPNKHKRNKLLKRRCVMHQCLSIYFKTVITYCNYI